MNSKLLSDVDSMTEKDERRHFLKDTTKLPCLKYNRANKSSQDNSFQQQVGLLESSTPSDNPVPERKKGILYTKISNGIIVHRYNT